MKKYKLIKEYPGSPELGAIALPYTDSRNKVVHYIVKRNKKKDFDFIALKMNWIENQPEYWEEVNDIWWLVFIKDVCSFEPWQPIRVEAYPNDTSDRKYFKSRTEAEHFILYNKPCLSMHDILERYGYSREFGKNSITFHGSEETLKELIKSKL